MFSRHYSPVTSYETADRFLRSGRDPDYRSTGQRGTCLTRFELGGYEGIAMRYHGTALVFFWPDGEVSFQTNGWRSMTTKNRMTQFAPRGVTIFQEKGRWGIRDSAGERRPYTDGIRVNAGGRFI